MTFSIVVPNAGQSPGLFPAQNNTNFQRIKEIVDNDHNWTDTASASQGIHKQATFINRTTPVGLPAGNGILYSKVDTLGASQLHWYNGASDVALTPGVIALSGSVSLIQNQFATIFPDPGYAYMAYAYASVQGAAPTTNPSNISTSIATHNSNNVNYATGGGAGVGLKFSYTGNDLQIQSILTATSVVQWTLQIIRLT